jgi:glycosyltransferase involved in cell wall biosynthesis
MSMELEDLFIKRVQGKLTDKWESYLRRYSNLFAEFKDRTISLLEIGIQNGGSLEVWASYFQNAEHIVGCDINPFCGLLEYDDARIKVIVGDATSRGTSSEILELSDSWDIVLDDGSHTSSDIIKAFSLYSGCVVNGGIYVVEDLHCSYWDAFEGGLSEPFSSISFFKRLADIVNHEHWGIDASRKSYLSDFADEYCCDFQEDTLARISSVEFTNSVCTIRFQPNTVNLLGRRIVRGTDELDGNNSTSFNGTLLIAPDQTNNAWSNLPPTLYMDLGKRERSSNELRAVNDAYIELIRSTELYISQLRDSQLLVKSLEDELNSAPFFLKGRYGQLLKKIKYTLDHIAPYSSKRRQSLKLASRILWRMSISAYRLSKSSLPIHSAYGNQSDLLPLNVVYGFSRGISPDYDQWIKDTEPSKETLIDQRSLSESYGDSTLLFSIILPIYKVPLEVLDKTIQSVRSQTWTSWELCIAFADKTNTENLDYLIQAAKDDERIKLVVLDDNEGISGNSNKALGLATGEFICLLDHDDELSPWSLFDMASHIRNNPDADFLYSDKDCTNSSGSIRMNPLFKPEWSPEMLYSVNYLTHFNVIRRKAVQLAGGWNSETDGAQDWDLFLRVSEKCRRILHVPSIHYHWRIIKGSTATGLQAKPYAARAQLKTLQDHVYRQRLACTVVPDLNNSYRLIWHVSNKPQIDLVIYGESGASSYLSTISMLEGYSDKIFTSVVIICDKTAMDDLRASLQNKPELPISYVLSVPGMKKAELVRIAIEQGKAPAVMLLDTSVVRLSQSSVIDMAGWTLLHPSISFCSPLILMADDTVVEAGRVVAANLQTQPLFRGSQLQKWGEFGGPLWYRNISCGSDLALIIKRDAIHLDYVTDKCEWQIAFTMLCKKSASYGLRALVSPYAKAYVANMPDLQGKWEESMRDDPYFHPHFNSVSPLSLG